MKKKIKDITIGEIKRACTKHRKCTRCPFADYLWCGFALDMNAEELEEEYDVKEETE